MSILPNNNIRLRADIGNILSEGNPVGVANTNKSYNVNIWSKYKPIPHEKVNSDGSLATDWWRAKNEKCGIFYRRGFKYKDFFEGSENVPPIYYTPWDLAMRNVNYNFQSKMGNFRLYWHVNYDASPVSYSIINNNVFEPNNGAYLEFLFILGTRSNDLEHLLRLSDLPDIRNCYIGVIAVINNFIKKISTSDITISQISNNSGVDYGLVTVHIYINRGDGNGRYYYELGDSIDIYPVLSNNIHYSVRSLISKTSLYKVPGLEAIHALVSWGFRLFTGISRDINVKLNDHHNMMTVIVPISYTNTRGNAGTIDNPLLIRIMAWGEYEDSHGNPQGFIDLVALKDFPLHTFNIPKDQSGTKDLTFEIPVPNENPSFPFLYSLSRVEIEISDEIGKYTSYSSWEPTKI